MKITLSKKKWQEIGQQNGWIKTASVSDQIIQDILVHAPQSVQNVEMGGQDPYVSISFKNSVYEINFVNPDGSKKFIGIIDPQSEDVGGFINKMQSSVDLYIQVDSMASAMLSKAGIRI